MYTKLFQLLLLSVTLISINASIFQKAFTSLANDHCNKSNEAYDRHMIVRNLNKTIEIGLNKTFNERFDCFQRTFDTNLVRLNKLYFEQLSNRTNTSQTDLPTKKKNKEKNQSSDSSFAQIGFIFYSINSNPKTNVEQFKHESILFLNPSNVLNLNITQLEQEIFALSNDVSILKSLLSQAKETLKEKVHLLKESKETKETKKSEKKFKTDKKN